MNTITHYVNTPASSGNATNGIDPSEAQDTLAQAQESLANLAPEECTPEEHSNRSERSQSSNYSRGSFSVGKPNVKIFVENSKSVSAATSLTLEAFAFNNSSDLLDRCTANINANEVIDSADSSFRRFSWASPGVPAGGCRGLSEISGALSINFELLEKNCSCIVVCVKEVLVQRRATSINAIAKHLYGDTPQMEKKLTTAASLNTTTRVKIQTDELYMSPQPLSDLSLVRSKFPCTRTIFFVAFSLQSSDGRWGFKCYNDEEPGTLSDVVAKRALALAEEAKSFNYLSSQTGFVFLSDAIQKSVMQKVLRVFRKSSDSSFSDVSASIPELTYSSRLSFSLPDNVSPSNSITLARQFAAFNSVTPSVRHPSSENPPHCSLTPTSTSSSHDSLSSADTDTGEDIEGMDTGEEIGINTGEDIGINTGEDTGINTGEYIDGMDTGERDASSIFNIPHCGKLFLEQGVFPGGITDDKYKYMQEKHPQNLEMGNNNQIADTNTASKSVLCGCSTPSASSSSLENGLQSPPRCAAGNHTCYCLRQCMHYNRLHECLLFLVEGQKVISRELLEGNRKIEFLIRKVGNL